MHLNICALANLSQMHVKGALLVLKTVLDVCAGQVVGYQDL